MSHSMICIRGAMRGHSHHAGIRLAGLIDRNWNRNKSAKLAMLEGISLTDQHGHVIDYLRTPANATDVSFGTSY